MTSATQSASSTAKQVARSEPVKIGARVGILSYGVTHLLIAWLALQLAFGGGRERADQSGAFETVAAQPLGRILLWVLVAGFAAVALWRLEQTEWGYTYVSDRTDRLRKRAVSGGKVVLFAVLAVLAARTAANGSSGGSGGQSATAGVLSLPGGQFLVGLAGIVILVVGAVKVKNGWDKKFTEDMALPTSPHARKVAVRSGQVGSIAKGVAIALIGALVVLASVTSRPEEASGLDVALRTLAAQPYGIVLLVAVALGLAAYGVFCAFDARYHRV